MVDIHCHILPGVDDGADSIDTACEMAEIAAQSGVSILVATPHCNTRNEVKNYKSPRMEERYRALQGILNHYEIPVTVVPGAEVMMRGDLERLIHDNRLFGINNTKYLLCEFYFDESADTMNERLAVVSGAGFIPVVAHPERYHEIQKDPLIAEAWVKKGYVLQANKGSILGVLSGEAEDTVNLLLRWGYISVVASDAHNSFDRNTDLLEVADYLMYNYPSEYVHLLFDDNPSRIVSGRPVELFRY